MLKASYIDIRLLLASQEQSSEAVTISNKIPVEVVEEKYTKYVKQLKLNKKRVIEITKEKKDTIKLIKIDLTRNLKRLINKLLPKMREKYINTFTTKNLAIDFNISKDIATNVANVLFYFDIVTKEKVSNQPEYKFKEESRFKYVN